MLHRTLSDVTPPEDADRDAPEMADAKAAHALAEQHLRMLTEIAEVGMELIRAIAQTAKADPSTVAAAGEAFCKVSQAVRRTIALQARLAADLKSGRADLAAERARRRAETAETHKAAKADAIIGGLHDAYFVSTPRPEYDDMVERLLEDTLEHLADADEMRGWLDRPVGETVAKLCTALGLDPDACAAEAGAWTVRRPPTEFEITRNEIRHNRGLLPPIPLPTSGGTGRDVSAKALARAEANRAGLWGNNDSRADPAARAPP